MPKEPKAPVSLLRLQKAPRSPQPHQATPPRWHDDAHPAAVVDGLFQHLDRGFVSVNPIVGSGPLYHSKHVRRHPVARGLATLRNHTVLVQRYRHHLVHSTCIDAGDQAERLARVVLCSDGRHFFAQDHVALIEFNSQLVKCSRQLCRLHAHCDQEPALDVHVTALRHKGQVEALLRHNPRRPHEPIPLELLHVKHQLGIQHPQHILASLQASPTRRGQNPPRPIPQPFVVHRQSNTL
mmetsp:Transcript_41311/g.101416  ORF Transcript_41311/g.101416 Transcript_41311/m.101416 type:complete len:238 (-) Transcript_41311:437-1150(-)